MKSDAISSIGRSELAQLRIACLVKKPESLV
jgi:hypothetical protein